MEGTLRSTKKSASRKKLRLYETVPFRINLNLHFINQLVIPAHRSHLGLAQRKLIQLPFELYAHTCYVNIPGSPLHFVQNKLTRLHIQTV